MRYTLACMELDAEEIIVTPMGGPPRVIAGIVTAKYTDGQFTMHRRYNGTPPRIGDTLTIDVEDETPDNGDPDGYRRARGAIKPSGEPAEQIMRRIRGQ
jgi:hypothetical protein